MPTLSTACFHVTGAGFLRLAGADRIDFIQRQSTNDLSGLAAGAHLETVLTNAAARIIDVLQIYPDGEDTLAAVTLHGRGPATAFFLKKRVFFNDRVTIEDASDSVRIVDLLGPAKVPGLPPVTDGELKTFDFGGSPVRALGQTGPLGPTTRLVIPLAGFEGLVAALEEAGLIALSDVDFESLRVEAGLPGPAGELTEDYTPLETGLRDLVSDVKGCYTGQEVIARQITYDKITKSLTGIRLDGPAAVGARVLSEDAAAGTVTSYANSPRHGHLALAVLKRPYGEPGAEVTVETGNGEVTGKVVELPFK